MHDLLNHQYHHQHHQQQHTRDTGSSPWVGLQVADTLLLVLPKDSLALMAVHSGRATARTAYNLTTHIGTASSPPPVLHSQITLEGSPPKAGPILRLQTTSQIIVVTFQHLPHSIKLNL